MSIDTAQTPRAAREQRGAEVKRLLRRVLVDACGTAVASALGVSRALLARWADAEADALWPPTDAAAPAVNVLTRGAA